MQQLTKREFDVLRVIRHCATSKQAAEAMGLSKRTIDFHLNNIYDKTGLRSLHLVLLSPEILQEVA